jgi:hypothetical protein
MQFCQYYLSFLLLCLLFEGQPYSLDFLLSERERIITLGSARGKCDYFLVFLNKLQQFCDTFKGKVCSTDLILSLIKRMVPLPSAIGESYFILTLWYLFLFSIKLLSFHQGIFQPKCHILHPKHHIYSSGIAIGDL